METTPDPFGNRQQPVANVITNPATWHQIRESHRLHRSPYKFPHRVGLSFEFSSGFRFVEGFAASESCEMARFLGVSFLTMKSAKEKRPTKKGTKEALKPVDDRKLGKRKAAVKADKSTKKLTKKEKAAKKDPNKPKRPPSAFFVFLEEFRKVYKQEHPNVKAVSVVGKAGGEKWKSLSDAEKAPYEAKAAKRKADYEKQISAYNKKQESMADDGEEESDRSKSEVNDDEEGSEEEEEEEEDDDEDDD
ncbi:high mobility group B protein 1-like protein isoform X1 [Cinnamomum micranthum f. kanehirae]|uniref:High mobility group B protein 1-like protein isoform X1 n=1 Tax=Cinnamomum micranthum f. kanehirae TaxID=337451 RepID=A0A3S3Q4W4_9MAGN|nr:high mobility group B protein 1-like protein isoform X1 [Cinnamomum micranthum f. kanehirae]